MGELVQELAENQMTEYQDATAEEPAAEEGYPLQDGSFEAAQPAE